MTNPCGNPLSMTQEEKKVGEEHVESHSKYTTILRSMLAKAVSNRFSSKPIDLEKHRLQQAQEGLGMLEEEGAGYESIRDTSVGDHPDTAAPTTEGGTGGSQPKLTPSEQAYLHNLLASENHDSIRQATLTLSDRSLFPREDQEEAALAKVKGTPDSQEPSLARRDSEVQQLLFRLHEIGRGPTPEDRETSGRRRLGWNERREGSIVRETQTSMSSFLNESMRRNSILTRNSIVMGQPDNDTESDIVESDNGTPRDPSKSSATTQNISSWLDGTAGDADGMASSAKIAAESFFKTSFAILGTSADDVSCHPHVLSPPLMESLLEFVPETLSDYHFWIKYSMIRDGANLYSCLRHARASTRTILAIETTDGAVFGSFTTQPWRFVNNLPAVVGDTIICEQQDDTEAFYGSQDSFLWKMKQSRFDSQRLVRSSTVEQAILMESELVVFPFTGRNNCVQHCGTEDGIGLGENTSALRIDASLRTGSTGASDAFGNPCLIDPKEERVDFQISNLEIWTLTPFDNVKDAENAEMVALFQQQHEERNKSLNVFNILVGGPKS